VSFHTEVLHRAAPGPQPARSWTGGGAQSILLLLVGAVLGPQGLLILDAHVLALIDPAVTVAVTLIAIAVTSDIELSHDSTWPSQGPRPLVPALLLAGGVTLLVVVMSRFVSLGGVAHALVDGLQGAGAALLVSAAGVLILASVTSDTERRVLQIAVILLLAGIADFLAQPAIIVGVVAGAFWRWRGGAAGDAVRQDVAYVERPLTALVLVIAGAHAEVSMVVSVLAIVYAALDAFLVRLLARRLITPVIAVAIALDVVRSAGPALWPLVSIVVVGSIVAQLLAPFGAERTASLDEEPA
jgi:hypothetical protein